MHKGKVNVQRHTPNLVSIAVRELSPLRAIDTVAIGNGLDAVGGSRSGLLALLGVRFDEKAHKEVTRRMLADRLDINDREGPVYLEYLRQRGQIGDIQAHRKDLAGSPHAWLPGATSLCNLNKEVGGCERTANKELSNLQGSKRALEEHGERQAQSGNGVVRVLFTWLASKIIIEQAEPERCTYHERMDQAVKDAEDPNGRSHVLDTSPHAKHGACMMISLEGRALLSLCENNHRIDNLVKLGQVEPISIKGQPTLPQLSLSLNPAHVGNALNKSPGETKGVVNRSRHSHKSPHRVDGQENVVSKHKVLEGPGLCNCVRLAVGIVVGDMHRGCIDGSNCERDGGGERCLEPGLGNCEGRVRIWPGNQRLWLDVYEIVCQRPNAGSCKPNGCHICACCV